MSNVGPYLEVHVDLGELPEVFVQEGLHVEALVWLKVLLLGGCRVSSCLGCDLLDRLDEHCRVILVPEADEGHFNLLEESLKYDVWHHEHPFELFVVHLGSLEESLGQGILLEDGLPAAFATITDPAIAVHSLSLHVEVVRHDCSNVLYRIKGDLLLDWKRYTERQHGE